MYTLYCHTVPVILTFSTQLTWKYSVIGIYVFLQPFVVLAINGSKSKLVLTEFTQTKSNFFLEANVTNISYSDLQAILDQFSLNLSQGACYIELVCRKNFLAMFIDVSFNHNVLVFNIIIN